MTSKSAVVPQTHDPHFEDEIAKIQGKLDNLIAICKEYALVDYASLFTEEILEMALSTNFKTPAILPYEGKNDPLEHVSIFNNHMNLTAMIGLACHKCFPVTLAKTSKKWFCKLPTGSIFLWTLLSKEFIQQF